MITTLLIIMSSIILRIVMVNMIGVINIIGIDIAPGGPRLQPATTWSCPSCPRSSGLPSTSSETSSNRLPGSG